MTRGLAAIGCAAALVAASPVSAATPLDELIKPETNSRACFTRAYDAAHLRAHPRQKTTAMTVWMKYESVGAPPVMALAVSLSITQRGDSHAMFISGGCAWQAKGANRDVQGKPVIKSFKKDGGAACTMSARPDVFEAISAEEGGELVLDPGKERGTLMVYLDDGLTMVKRADRAKQLVIEFGADDRVFLLRRTDIKDCATVEEAVTTPEPGVPRRQR